MNKKAIIYLRVSTEEQVDNFSLDTQEELYRKEASKRGYEIIETFREEGKSAKTILGRPILIKLLEFCRKHKKEIDAVIIYRLDRISRKTADYLAIRQKLNENNINIISATEPTGDSPTEKLVETMLAGFAQLDNDIRSERTKNGLRARFLSGLTWGKAPLGYVFQNGYPVKDSEAFDKVKTAWDLMATGTKSLREMAKIMNDWGLKEICRKTKYKLRTQTVNRIFRLKFYMGIIVSKKHPEEIRGQHVPMITEQQFYRVQAILDGRYKNIIALSKRNHENVAFPLRRIIKCDKCGIGLTGGLSRGRHGGQYAYYRCSGICKNSSIKSNKLNETLMNLLKQITPTPECLDLFISKLHKNYYERQSRLQKIRNTAENEIIRLKEMRKILVEKNLNGIYSDEIFKEQNAIIENKMIRAQIAKDDTIFEKYDITKIATFIKTLLADIGKTYKKSTIPQIKVLLGSIFPSGLSWDYSGTLKHQISPIFKEIIDNGTNKVPFCAEGGT